jgi:FkbM family methyltransferase
MTPEAIPFDLERKRQEDREIRKQFRALVDLLKKLPPARRGRAQARFAQRLIDRPFILETPRGPLSFVMLGKRSAKRAISLLTKQPGTIEWIHSFQPDSVFWDVGANVGVYALYAALSGDVRVVAFEPAAVNYFMLAANCEANKLENRVQCLLLGLGSERSIARIEVSQFAAGQSFSFLGKPKEPWQGRQAALVLPIDELIEDYGVACPNYIKIDVPGLTESIIQGAARMRELHIEMREDSEVGRRIADVLARNGFVLARRHGHPTGSSTDLTFVRR